MDVRCPQCQTLYELETAQLKAPVITLKCSQCQHVFRIETKQSSLVQENQRRWMIRAGVTGDILYVTGFDVLHQLLMQGKIKKSDEISRTGKNWTVLSEIGEFMPIFHVIESISNLMGNNEDSQVAAELLPEDVPVEKERVRVETEIQYGSTEEVTQRAMPSEPNPSPAPRRQTGPQDLPPSPTGRHKRVPTPIPAVEEDSWAMGNVPSTTFDQEATSQTYVPKSRLPMVLVVLLVLGLGGTYAYLFHKSEIESALGMQSDTVVALGDPKTPAAEPVEVSGDPFGETQKLVRRAQASALDSADIANFEVMTKVLGALRPKMSQALGLATEEAEVAAESGGIDHKLAEAKRNLDRSRPQQALNLYQDVLGIDSRNASAAVGVGWSLLQLGRHDEASAQFRRAVELDTRGDALIGLGSAERQRGNLKAAMEAYDLYLGRHPRGDKVSIAQYQIDALRRQLGLH